VTPAIRVLLVDDHPVVRQGLRALLSTQDGIDVVGEAGDGEAAVAVAEDPSIDLSDLLQALAQSASGDSPPHDHLLSASPVFESASWL